MKIYLFLALYLFSIHARAADPAPDCHDFPQPLNGKYCIYKSEQSKNTDVLYYLHGVEGSERYWADNWYYTRQIRDYWKAHNQDQPTVVAITFGPVWLLTAKNSSQYGGLLDVLTTQIMPMIESQIGGVKNANRMVMGESMGGFNSVQLALKTNLFSKAAILCAPMALVSPFASESEIDTYVKQSSAWQYYKDFDPNSVRGAVKKALFLARTFYPSVGEWTDGDPVQLSAVKKQNYPKLYVAVGYYDRYVNYEGNEKFVQQLQANGADVEWHPMWGGHCSMDIPSLAEFLVK